jgi:V/A-type H+/Na+-transporting ATPase subunit I
MKESMKKLVLLTFYKEKEEVVDQLQNLGVVHVETGEETGGEELDRLMDEKEDWDTALLLLRQFADGEDHREARQITDPEDIKKRVLDLDEQLENLNHRLSHVRKEEQLLKVWGNFHWEKIRELRSAGVFLHFYHAPKREFEQSDFGQAVPVLVRETVGIVHFALLGSGEAPELPFEHVALPERSLQEVRDERHSVEKDIEGVRKKLGNLSAALPLLEKGQKNLSDIISQELAKGSFQSLADGKIVVMRGWFPVRVQGKVENFLRERNLTHLIEKPKPGDKVPIILKNRAYPKLFETITRIFQLPNYFELDLTPLIAVFYPLFFAYCLGDAGYGLVLVIAALVGYFTFLKKARNVAMLGLILGIMTAVVGIVKSGGVFGIPITSHRDVPIFDFLSRYVVITDAQDDVFNSFNVALMVGVVQIFVAVISAIVRRYKFFGWIYALGSVGKLLILAGTLVIFLGSMQKVELFMPYTGIATVLLFAGIGLVLLFHDPDIPLLSRVGGGVLPLYFIFTGFLGDVLSYIRLFALGVASSILGLVVNQIGMQMMEGAGPVGIIMSVLFLIVGHSLNLALACLGAFVHPLRLTFVEFYNNAGFEGGGEEYRPFRKLSLDNP